MPHLVHDTTVIIAHHGRCVCVFIVKETRQQISERITIFFSHFFFEFCPLVPPPSICIYPWGHVCRFAVHTYIYIIQTTLQHMLVKKR